MIKLDIKFNHLLKKFIIKMKLAEGQKKEIADTLVRHKQLKV